MSLRKLYFKLRTLLNKPKFILRKVQIGQECFVEPRSFIANTKIGDFSYVGHNCVIDKTIIGNYCSIAAFCQTGGMEHSYWWYSTSPRLSDKGIKTTTTIGHDVWIGSKVSIRQGVKIGNGAVIGAHSVVLKDVAPYVIVVGSPAKEIKKRFSEEEIKIIEESKYYNYPPEKAKEILEKLNLNLDK